MTPVVGINEFSESKKKVRDFLFILSENVRLPLREKLLLSV